MAGSFVITQEPLSSLSTYARIPIQFKVRRVFKFSEDDPARTKRIEVKVGKPWLKDYDAVLGERPADWKERWDLSAWGVLAARVDSRRVGGAVLAYDTVGVDMLEGRNDLAILWDLRVRPDFRRRGIGQGLFDAARTWALDRSCRELKVETQNINVPACRFYEKQGCRLTSIRPNAYEDFPDEVELIWSLRL